MLKIELTCPKCKIKMPVEIEGFTKDGKSYLGHCLLCSHPVFTPVKIKGHPFLRRRRSNR